MILKDVEPFEAYGVKPDDCKYEGNDFFAYVAGVQSVLEKLDNAPEVDPESLPVVKQLRAELETVKKERGELGSLCGKLVVLCEPTQKWRQKLFRKYQGTMIGDYMGSGYPFVDDFNRIWADFEETASDGAYNALRKYADAAMAKRKDTAHE